MSSPSTEDGRRPDSLSETVIIYCCYGGTHSSPVAAAIHLGRLPRDRVPTREELMTVPFFDRQTAKERGRLLFAGVDRFNRRVFVLGRGSEPEGVEAAVRSGWQLAGGHGPALRFVDTLPCVNVWMRIGGFLSRAVGLVAIGRPVVLFGTRRAYRNLCRLVEQVEDP